MNLRKTLSSLIIVFLLFGCQSAAVRRKPLKSQVRFPGAAIVTVLTENNKPLRGFQVTLKSDAYQRRKLVNRAGKASFERLPLGSYIIEAAPDPNSRKDQSRFANKECISYLPLKQTISLTAQQSRWQGELRPQKGRELRGRIFDVNGENGIANAKIMIEKRAKSKERTVTMSDRDGNFVFHGLGQADYLLGYSLTDQFGELAFFPHEVITETINSETRFTMVTLKRSSFAGTIMNTRNQPAANVSMMILRQGGSSNQHVEFKTDEKGRYLVDGVLPGLYDIYLLPDDAIQVKNTLVLKEAETLNETNFQLIEGGRVNGWLINELTNAPMPMEITLYGVDVFSTPFTITKHADENGAFAFEHLRNGRYSFIINDPKTRKELKTVKFQINDSKKMDDYVIKLRRRKQKVRIINH